jgi:hypothetical protein
MKNKNRINEKKDRHSPLAQDEALVLDTPGAEMPEVKVGVNREYSNAQAVFSEKNPAKKKNRSNEPRTHEN